MDYEAPKEWEHYCALVEIEEDLEKFLELGSNIVRLLAEQEARLKRPEAGFATDVAVLRDYERRVRLYKSV